VDMLRERNTYARRSFPFESQLRSLVTTLDSFPDEIDRGLRNLERERLNFSAPGSLKVAERRVENNELLFKAGRLGIINLRESQDDLIIAQNELTAAIVVYQNNRLSCC